ncbi:putative integral membrane protein [Pseudomonas sp. BP8]|nr:putative integral membrane protein [Pseudomonas sp. BP8]
MQIAGRSPASHTTNPLVDKQSESVAIRQPLPWLLILILILILLLILIYQRLQEAEWRSCAGRWRPWMAGKR